MLVTEKKIRENIRRIIRSNGMTQRAVASKMNYSAVSFSQLMSGKIPLSEKHIRKISRAVGVDAAEFYKDVWPTKKTEISHKPTKDKELNEKMEKLADRLGRLDREEANDILESILNLVEKFTSSTE